MLLFDFMGSTCILELPGRPGIRAFSTVRKLPINRKPGSPQPAPELELVSYSSFLSVIVIPLLLNQ
jgi:hypothetical protein